MEEVITILEVYNAVQEVKELVGSDDTSLSTIVDLLDNTTDGEINTDEERLLSEIKETLMFNEDTTAIAEISSRLELMDKRLDTEFTVLNYGIGVIGSVLLAYTSMKFMSWVFRFITY